jgi:hypothetical protein
MHCRCRMEIEELKLWSVNRRIEALQLDVVKKSYFIKIQFARRKEITESVAVKAVERKNMNNELIWN